MKKIIHDRKRRDRYRFDCVGLGIISMDHLMVLDRFPDPDSKNKIKELVRQGGGPVPTALAMLSMLGGHCAIVSKVGRDASGLELQRELESYGISTDFLVVDGQIPTPDAFIMIDDSDGSRTVLLRRAPGTDLASGELRREWFENIKLLHLDGHEIGACLTAARWVKKARTKVSIDVGSARRVPRDLWSWIDYAIVSEDYADAFLVPCDPQKSVQQLLDFGVAMGAVTCGSSGSYFADSESSCFQPALPVDVRDTTGAGDVFHGAALYGILCGYKIQEIALFASAAAALSCTKVGGKEGIPALSEIKGYLTYLNENTEFITRRHTIR